MRTNLPKYKQDYFENVNAELIEIDTLEIKHPALSKTYRICRDTENNRFRLENDSIVTFTAVNFSVKPIRLDERIEAALDFQIDIVNFELVSELDKIFGKFQTDNLTIVYRTYIKGKLDSPLIAPNYFELKGFNIKDGKLVASATIHEFVNTKFPKRTFDRRIFHGFSFAEKSE